MPGISVAGTRGRAVWTFVWSWAALVAVPSMVEGATACYTQNCLATCTPNAPAAVSTLISGFPGGTDTPIVFVDPADNLPHRFVATQEGVIFVWSGVTQTLLPTPFLDLSPSGLNKVAFGGERGLLAMAVEPDYLTSGRIYVYYTRLSDGDIVVERYQRSGNPEIADSASGAVIFRIDHPASNHNGGQLAFGPDGYLYISIGDGGPQCDNGAGAAGDGQSPGTLLGKILRIDVRGVDPTPAPTECSLDAAIYTVPSDNPYVGQANACNEVWALGMRNPFRFTFDRLTGDLYLGDVGQSEWEEINLIRASTPAPVNLGWVCREGCSSSAVSSGCSTTGCPADAGATCEFPRASGIFWDPILCHQNSPWVSIMGGYRYRGEHVPVNAGRYFYGDAACGQVWATTTLDPANPAAIASACWLSGSSNYGFGEDRLGELYIVRGGAGTVDCIHNGQGCYWAGWGGFFEDGFETGSTVRWSSAVP